MPHATFELKLSPEKMGMGRRSEKKEYLLGRLLLYMNRSPKKSIKKKKKGEGE